MRSILWLYLVTGIRSKIVDDLPHCSRSTVMEGEIREYDNMGRPKIYSSVQLSMALHELSCMTIRTNGSESSILHTLEFLRLEQHHPVSGMYQFGIPKITSACICDCAGGDAPCKMEHYNYRNCSSGVLCYRTYHPVQSNVGCIVEQKSEACCELRIEPFKDWVFTAIKISQPATILVFSIYDRFNKQWRKTSEEVVEVPLNRGLSKFDFNGRSKIEMVVTGSRPNRELQPGMYFLREGTHEIRGYISINEVGESNLEKLGWMRYSEGKWDIRNGNVKIKQAHHVNVADCKQQQYTSTINGEQMVLVSGNDIEENYDLGRALTSDPWVETAVYQGRNVRVEHAEGTSVLVYITSETRPHMLRHISQMESFDGRIQVDRESNRYLNISFLGTKGTLIGNIFSSEKKDQIDMAFSVQVEGSKLRDYRSIISIPSSINSSRYVCFHPSGDVEGERCKWFRYEAQSLNSYRVAHRWQSGKGECAGCNERGAELFLSSLDPRQWLNGINTPVEAFTVAVEVAIGVCLLFAFVLICTKCFIPLLCCTLSVAKSPKK
ncbi:hypothetical protein RB195_018433 [Necator americanus]|uniref:Phlebovirus glycoprotein G2 fusion domain-containing protein n=1 Tax=Necator americanus TaxID=51031 RepID=A0ABR1C9T6_NECAM